MMNDSNEISHQTKLYGFIGEFAGQSSISAKLNKVFKAKNKDAMMIPMNIREDDFYFTVSNMKKSHVNGTLISNEYVTNVVEILDESSDIVKHSGMCDMLIRDGEKLIGDILSINVLKEFLKNRDVKKIALIGINHYAKAFAFNTQGFEVSYFNDDLESLMSFTTDMEIVDADINRIADGMSVDFSKYDAVIDFSDIQNFEMVNNLSLINIDMKPKKQFSSLKARTHVLEDSYIGFDELLDEFSEAVFEYFKLKKHLDYDKPDMRF
ncbi:hypothetical protein HUE87_09490 [Candidatus Sulfurimonas marisnigri]|uniref:Shikimate dehydrogenase substrate binding N-terminal domain-containing protein n=1 Tax=Candidatus Sulfurimonas marisnigri TaxID=2740405 RepID=A0A7S7M0Q6_9BACT|nr:hypothetical protein [Candidatus Sulfurimonas marisnigri]QOY54109.1 hypothetical protein HUE87_09490 [Candidatus Sulfurimonas marisnigri]